MRSFAMVERLWFVRRACRARTWCKRPTEIAVFNRLGLALATDSAVTITGGGRVKVFNTADELFELSPRYPVAIMFNGNMDCLGVPWEILVKDFRASQGDRDRPTIDLWAKDFLAYVESHGLVSEQTVGGYVENVAAREIEAIKNRVGGKIRSYVFSRPIEKFDTNKFDIRKVLLETIEERQQFMPESL